MHTRRDVLPALRVRGIALLGMLVVWVGCRPSSAHHEAGEATPPRASGGATGVATGGTAGRSLADLPSLAPLPELSEAARVGDLKKVGLLLSKGADVNGIPGDRRPPLCTALWPVVGEASKRSGPHPVPKMVLERYRHKLQIARLLLERGAKVNVADEWTLTPLHHAASFAGDERTFIPIVEELLRRGARVDARTDVGVTPLLLAVDRRRTAVARMLLKAGADPTIAGPDGKSAARLAQDYGLLDLMREMDGMSPRVPSPAPLRP